MRALMAALATLLLVQQTSAYLQGMPCVATAASESWSFALSGGQLQSSSAGLCATAQGPIVDGTHVTMEVCTKGSSAQQFVYDNATSWIVLASEPTFCLNLLAYDPPAGTEIWLYTCTQSGCQGNCDWTISHPSPLDGGGSLQLRNEESGLCLDDGSLVLPGTCEAGSPSFGLPFCDYNLPLDARVRDLQSRLTLEQRKALFVTPYPPSAYDPVLNLKSMWWDITCIQGLSLNQADPIRNVTVFPNAIVQAASFDLDLVARISRATALEARILNVLNYNASGGTTWQGRSCDGGPLANSMHDPRCACACVCTAASCCRYVLADTRSQISQHVVVKRLLPIRAHLPILFH